MASGTARRVEVKAQAYLTSKEAGDVRRAEPALVVSDKNGKEILLINKSDAMDLIVDMKQIMKKMI